MLNSALLTDWLKSWKLKLMSWMKIRFEMMLQKSLWAQFHLMTEQLSRIPLDS